MKHWFSASRPVTGWLAAGICASTAVLFWLGYRGIERWEASSTLLASRRADQAADLLAQAVMRDMRDVQRSVLPSIINTPSDASRRVAGAFARFPYPEAFFGWQGSATPETVVFYGRSDRHPAWMPAPDAEGRFPVLTTNAPAAARPLIEHIMADGSRGYRLSAFDLTIGDEPYQVVAALSYHDRYPDRPEFVFGFVVNLAWVRHNYFDELLPEIARIADAGAPMSLSIADDHGLITANGPLSPGSGPVARRRFPVLFFDPLQVPFNIRTPVAPLYWIAQASIANDPALMVARQGVRRTVTVAIVSGVTLVVGLLLVVAAARANADLADMRAQFVSAVTHELKTPVAAIRVLGETLASGRITTLNESREYAALTVQETRRLTRLIDNLLAYARLTDLGKMYSFAPVSVQTIVDGALEEFATTLAVGGFEIHKEIPDGLPPVRVDRTAIALLIDNVLDNALRYSADVHWLGIRARARDGGVDVEISDRGIGIEPAELAHVTDRFFRGSQSGVSGSGLGLAIAQRIAVDHGGSLAIQSDCGRGTTVTISLVADTSSTGVSALGQDLPSLTSGVHSREAS